MLEIIEYFWDEQNQHGHFVYENVYTGEITQHSRPKPFPPENKIFWLSPGEDLRSKYFAELVTFLKTQDPYGDHAPV